MSRRVIQTSILVEKTQTTFGSKGDLVTNIVICSPVRSAVGAFGGQFKDIPVEDLATEVIEGLMEKSGLPGDAVDNVILGHCYPTMEAPAIGRVAALNAGLPITAGGAQVDRRCGSGLYSVALAAGEIATGAAEVVIAGGADSMSRAPFYTEEIRFGVKTPGINLKDGLVRGRTTAGGKNHPVPGGMIETAENLRADYGIPREEQDALAVESHRRAAAAVEGGLFDDEIVPMTIPATRKVPEHQVTSDEHIRPGTSAEKLAKLRPIMGKQDDNATVTAGNASGQNDGAAACIVTTEEKARELGLTPLVRLVSWAQSGVDPTRMGIGPVPATSAALKRADLTLADIDLIELNEAFAAQTLAVTREWGFGEFPADGEVPESSDFARVNVNGSGISLGHPVGATGGRILATLAHEMHRRDARYGLETMCIGGGQGLAAVFERI